MVPPPGRSVAKLHGTCVSSEAMDRPILTISYRTHPNIADNIFDAQMDGAPKVLTYDGTNPTVRRAAMRFNDGGYSGRVPIVKPNAAFLSGGKTDRDEYPFACTLEGGTASRIAHVAKIVQPVR